METARRYRYNGSDDSLFVRLFLRRFWDWSMRFVPLWIAPNLLTFAGFLFGVISFLLSFIFSDGLTKGLPPWVCVTNSLSLWAYHTLDNLDGRQARRTNTSSPLGQFFDHGCDALTSVLELLKLVATVNLQCTIPTFCFVFMMACGFFSASFEEYVTGHFHLGLINGPDEGLFVMIFIHLAVAIRPRLDRVFQTIPIYVTFIVAFIVTVVFIIRSIAAHAWEEPARRNRAIIGAIPALVTISIVVANTLRNPESIKSPWFIMGAAFVMQYQAQLAIVAHLVGRPPWRLIAEPTLVLLWVLRLVAFAIDPANLRTFWLCFFVVVVLAIVAFDLQVVFGFSRGLGIKIFTIRPTAALGVDERHPTEPEPLVDIADIE